MPSAVLTPSSVVRLTNATTTGGYHGFTPFHPIIGLDAALSTAFWVRFGLKHKASAAGLAQGDFGMQASFTANGEVLGTTTHDLFTAATQAAYVPITGQTYTNTTGEGCTAELAQTLPPTEFWVQFGIDYALSGGSTPGGARITTIAGTRR